MIKIYKATELIRIFKRNGFVLKRQTGSHCVLQHYLSGRMTVIPIHGGKDLSRGLFKKILKDVEMSIDDFMKLL